MDVYLHLGVSILVIALSIPLILRKVPMNHVYGVRFTQSYKSDKAWFEINAYGGKMLLIWNLPPLLIGIFRLMESDAPAYFGALHSGIFIVCVLAACLQSYARARKIGRNGE